MSEVSRQPLTFLATCPFCSTVLDAVPVTDTWHEAMLWCYLAQRTHECPIAVAADPPQGAH